jgi:hypothetical protein
MHAGTRPIGDVARVTGIGSMVSHATAPERRRRAGSAHAGTEPRGYAWRHAGTEPRGYAW